MFKSFSGTLASVSVELTGTNPVAGWIYFNDSNTETHEVTITDPLAGPAVVRVGPREIQKIQTAVLTIETDGIGAYRALCFQSLTAFRLFSVAGQPAGTFTAEYQPDDETIESFVGIQPTPVLRLKDLGIKPQHISAELQAELGNLSGVTVIEDEGELEGDYSGTVYCAGDATVTGNVTIQGDLIQLWSSLTSPTIVNSGKFNVGVMGSMHIYNYDSTPTTEGTSKNGDLYVYGHLTFAHIDIPSTFSPSNVYVGGSLTGNAGGPYHSTLDLHGMDDTDATSLTVYGDLVCGEVNLSGGDADAVTAGNGASVIVYGDMVLASWLKLNGGEATGGGGGGDGGNLLVYGDLIIDQYLEAYGGSGLTTGSGGDGGDVEVYGDLLVSGSTGSPAVSINMRGGYCGSIDGNHRAGSGGQLEVRGDISVSDYIRADGGDRGGASATPALVGPPADGGTITAYGDVRAVGFTAQGGAVLTPAAGGAAGAGGNLYAHMSVHMEYINLRGGHGTNNTLTATSAGGSGGRVGLNDTALACPSLVVQYEMHVHGGEGGAAGGAGGTIYAASIIGGSDLDVFAQGGGGAAGSGGAGGTITVLGPVIVRNLLAQGGDGTSTVSTDVAGQGGDVDAQSITVLNEMCVDGGTRSGTIVGVTGSSQQPNAGDITVRGSLVVGGTVTLDGGDNLALDNGNNNAGNGGALVVYGSVTAEPGAVISCAGGDADDEGNAGHGGTMTFHGPVQVATLQANGGSGDATPGSHGSPGSISFAGGCVCEEVVLQDGTGGGTADAASGTNTELVLGGACFINEINVTSRTTAAKILGATAGATLKVGVLTPKTTLDNTLVATTAQLTPEENLYLYDDTTGWYAVAGTLI
jgi:hypothetical protein